MNDVFDGRFWEEHFRTVFARQISYFCAAVETRLLPTFDSSAEEGEQATSAEWERLGQAGASDSTDPSDDADQADQVGVDHFLLLEGVRQTLINLSVAALYHLFDQQLMVFHRRQVLHPRDENNAALMKIAELKARLSSKGVDIGSFRSWSKVDELKAVANAVKHAEGHSADEVRRMRPDLFTPPHLRGSATPDPSVERVYLPLAGEDIFLTVNDLRQYCSVVLEFWEELGAAIRATHEQDENDYI